MMRTWTFALAFMALLTPAPTCAAEPLPWATPVPDNTLSPEEQAAGWQLLFDGKEFGKWKAIEGWKTGDLSESKTPIENGAINPHKAGGPSQGSYMMVYDQPLGDFVLSLDLKLSKPCNSGIFLRTSPLQPQPGRDIGYNGIEVAIDTTTSTSYTDPGAIYDLSRPTRNAMKTPGEWNHIVITSHENLITVMINGEIVNVCDMDEFDQPGLKPNGEPHKYGKDKVFKDHPRVGYIGLQDHGAPCWYKNIKLRPIGEQPAS